MLTTNNTERTIKEVNIMVNEEIYKSMRFSAICNIVIGVLLIVSAVAAGVMMFISGGKLLRNKSKIIF